MVDMLFAHVFYTKIVDDQCEGDRLHMVFPQARGITTLVMTVGEETFTKELVRQDAGLREAPNRPMHLKVNE